ncbi:MAG TPA: radical SAM protein [Thermoanaerobacterales bacterium]|nr:radical SAM protein [Thermoanaerobacterales bacterium]
MPWEDTKKIKELAEEEISFVPFKNFKSVPTNVVLIYPNSYSLGMSNLGFHSIYSQINSREDSLCHRAFASLGDNDFSKIRAFESGQPLDVYDIIAFSISFELDYINVLKILDRSGLPVLAKDRERPLVIAGGPSVTFNPEPLAPFFDAFVIGEGEEVIHEIIETFANIKYRSKQEILEGLSALQGVYVPAFYKVEYDGKGRVSEFSVKTEVPARIRKRWIKRLDDIKTESVILTPNTEFKDMFLLEVSRGCGRNCRFCMAGYCYRVPRERSLGCVLERAEFGSKYKKKIGLVGAAISDYSHIDEISEKFIKKQIKFSVSSLRADTLREPLMEGLARSGHRTLTIAPEAGSQRLRNLINKGIDESHVINSINLAYKYGICNIKLYYIIGLPTETDGDIDEMIDFLIKIKDFMKKMGNKTGNLSISVNPFIPKPWTPFQWVGMESTDILNKKISRLENALKPRGIRVLSESPRLSEIQAALARGDRLMGFLLYEVYKLGGKTSSYKKVEIEGKNLEHYAHRSLDFEDILPWDHMDIGLKKEYFINEYKRALQGKFTRRCTDEICSTCSICQHKGGGE